MRKTIVTATLISLTTSAAALAATQDGNADYSWLDGSWYLGAKAGANFIPNRLKLNTTLSGIPTTGQAAYKDGYIGAIQGGYGLNSGFRLELEGAFRRNQVNQVQYGLQGEGSSSNTTISVNGFYDIPVDFVIKPYVGFGVGAAEYSPYHLTAISNPAPGIFTGIARQSGDAWNFAYQAIGGVSYNIDANLALSLEYRFFDLPDQHHPAGTVNDYQSNSAMVGIRYSFGQPPGRPAPVAQTYVPIPPVQAPLPAPMAKSYMVFFDFNKSDLTGEARSVVGEAAHNALAGKITRLEVTGHTDTVGSDAYNMRLSQRRAQSVAGELERDGISPAEISIVAKGKRSPLVPTRDGVREPQNRRVQIVLFNSPTS